MDIRRGEVYYLVKENLIGRPAVIVSADEINQTGPNAQCVYISLKPHGDMDTHVDVCMGDDGRFGTAICERVCPVYEDRLGDYMFTLSAEDKRRIDDALRKVFNLGQPVEVSEKTIRRHRWTKAEDRKLLEAAQRAAYWSMAEQLNRRYKVVKKEEAQNEPAEENNVGAPADPDADSIETLGLSTRAKNGLLRRDVRTIEQLTRMTLRDLMRTRNVGVSVAEEIQKALADRGLKLREE